MLFCHLLIVSVPLMALAVEEDLENQEGDAVARQDYNRTNA